MQFNSNIIFNDTVKTPYIMLKGMSEQPNICHAFSTRIGGVSKGIYTSLNLGLHLEDKRENVLENYRRFSESVGFDYTRISCPNQVHKDNILIVAEEDAGDGITRELTHFEIDAQITNVKNLPLIVYTADCVPILLADPVNGVVASIHAGWRGTVAGIAAKTVNKMRDTFGCLPENIHAAIGPSIGPDNYEVDKTVIDEILKCPFIDMSEDNLSYTPVENGSNEDCNVFCHSGTYVREKIPDNYIGITQSHKGAAYNIFRTVNYRNRFMLNLWNLNELILVNSGLKMGNIYNSKICTMSNHELFFSHRYTKGQRGLNAGIIMLT